MNQRIIGITGGIATGKTTVSDYLQSTYGLPILDADIYAREALTGDRLSQIRDRYGKLVFDDLGNLDRRKLGAIVFESESDRKWLEALIHPYVQKCLLNEANRLSPSTVVMVIPLLFEAKMEDLVTEIWTITCDPHQQIQRLINRNHLSEPEAKQRISSQMSQSEKIELADIVIINSDKGSNAENLKELFFQVDQALFNSPLGFSVIN
ncbi:dephospho-CoA kinase [Pseudanabaena sp. FACHB-1998]|uniref:dephospho-CoA kinase n=1 Tax=Pseudanabaena sp. FACHB-1998 TaxID=2692858 RepID=UPI001681B497|nr:dephospho-CoA kinase [Pseudanabaena sp. FACHB-1998]MBD2177218.1 dephospho-CoA kinase [Pseudanabaena sp. FACHB-1998]